ncbi:MAG: RHS repeat-associated core domain-containing protein, partial [Parvularculaceae bacterium]|nr:RHS repeat-associated core domain-containing protein [Parvularculaceae bacterium]
GLAELNRILGAFGTSLGGTGYKVEADWNSDGAVNLTALTLHSTASGDTISRGSLSGSGNIIGYAGYIFEPATGMYISRNRFYSPALGRWMSRDPIGYAGGMYLYEYAASSAVRLRDPLGLAPYVEGSDPPPDLEWRRLKQESDRLFRSGSPFVDSDPGYALGLKIRARLTALGGPFAGILRGFENMPDAADFFRHFLGGSGNAKHVQYSRIISEDTGAKVHYRGQLREAMKYAEMLAREEEYVPITQTDEVLGRVSTQNWIFSINGYQTWGRGIVYKCKDEFTMLWELNLNDFYDWKRFSTDGGGLVMDGEMAELHSSILHPAREFPVHGRVSILLKWKREAWRRWTPAQVPLP